MSVGTASKGEIERVLETLHEKHRNVDEGAVATYIPELGKADPSQFGVALATVSGEVFDTGNCAAAFTIQSVSKPFVYGLALSFHGRDKVLERVGVEPSGEAFNAIVLDEKTNRPFNPMVNAGAIATTSLIPGDTLEEKRTRMHAVFNAAAGRELKVDQAVFESERATGHRNRAIAWLMRNSGMIDGNVDEILELYFEQCSILVTARDLAVMGATFANMGINPVTHENVFEMSCVQDVLSVMFTCGMYDSSGEWAYRVGIPAKSGVAGGLLGVVNRQMGIGTYSPKLDAQGNSVRGVRICADLSEELGLHAFNFMNQGSHFLRLLMDEE